MVWTHAEERWMIYWEKDAEYGAPWQEEKRKITGKRMLGFHEMVHCGKPRESSQKIYTVDACGHTLWCHQSYMCHMILQVPTDSPLKLLMLCSGVLQTH